MRTLSKITLLALVITSASFVGCKKGEGDPFLSLSSRKARMAGDWKVASGTGTETSVFGNTTITETHTYDGAVMTTVTTPGNTTSIDKFTQEMSFDKDGRFTIVYTDNNGNTPTVTTTSGQWNFTGGVGEQKNKSQLILYTESVSSGNSSMTYTGADRPTTLYDIYQLKGKEIILKTVGSSSFGPTTQDMTWTLEPK